MVSIARTHTEHHILHPLDMVSILYPVYMYLVTDFGQCTTHRGSPPTQSDGPYSRRAVLFGAGAHASRARDARRPSRSRDSRRADAMVRFPLRRRVASPAPRAHAPRRARRCPPIAAAAVVALFLSATASARSKRRSMRTGARSRHDLCSADDARAGRRVRASGTRFEKRDAFRTLPLTRAFSLAPPISPFAVRDRRSSSLASSSPSSSPNSRPST